MSEQQITSFPNCLIKNLLLQPVVWMGASNSVTWLRKGKSPLLQWRGGRLPAELWQGLCIITSQCCSLAANCVPCSRFLGGSDLSQRLPKSTYFEWHHIRCRGHGCAQHCNHSAEQGRAVWGTAAVPMAQGFSFVLGKVRVSWWHPDTTMLNSACSARELLSLNCWEIPR